ncbi:MAG TPA: TetR/AcrR family transcriptional regulator C-terminal domain-containing protein [Actinomycetota bacterium]
MKSTEDRASAKREPLTRERVVEAALRVMDEEGLEAVSMRRVAREVGVEAMSLYNHVRDKEDLLDGVAVRVMAEFGFPDEDEAADPIGYGREVARAWRRLLRAHPNVIALFATRHKPFGDVESLRPMEVALRALTDVGLSAEDAVQAFHVFGGYIMGYVLMETGQMFGPGDDGGADVEALRRTLPAEDLPNVTAALPWLATCDLDAQFEFGLDLLLEGLRARVAAAQPAGRGPAVGRRRS